MKCELCGSGRQNSILYGEFLTKNGKGVHTHCLYLSSALKQSGEENEGFLGFLPSDVEDERRRVAGIRCCYCGKMRANIGCCGVRCYRNFHMICGLEHGAMNQFTCTFRSFCDRHVHKVQARPSRSDICVICYDSIYKDCGRFSAVRMIRAACCKNGWFHKYCLQEMAKNAGYFFKCPLCNDCEKFKAHVSAWGIFVYDKDAEWELVPNAFAELLERPRLCIAEICTNRRGREQDNKANPFIYCTTCGSVAKHRKCIPHTDNTFECDDCRQILCADSGRDNENSQEEVNETITDVEEECDDVHIDVCGTSEDEANNNRNSEDDGAADIIRRNNNNRNRTAMQIKDDDVDEVVSAASGDDEEAPIFSKRNYITTIAKRYIIDNTDDDYNENVNVTKATNNWQEYKEIVNCYQAVSNSCSNNDGVDHEKCYSANDGLKVDTVHSRHMTGDSRPCKEEESYRRVPELADNLQNISCIAQRTRRKSIALLPLSPEEERPSYSYATESYDADSSCDSLQTSQNYQVFQYDDDSYDAQNMGRTKDNQQEALQHEGKTELAEYLSKSKNEYDEEHMKVEVRQREQEVWSNGNNANSNNRYNDANTHDISCIANRTRRRSICSKISPAKRWSLHQSTAVAPPALQTTPTNTTFTYQDYSSDSSDNENEYSCASDNNDGLMEYFYHILSEVKRGRKENTTERNEKMSNPLNISCIANRTRRRSSETSNNKLKAINGDHSYASIYNKRNEWECNSNGSSTITADSGNTIKNEKAEASSSSESSRDTNNQSEPSTSGDATSQKRKCHFDTNLPMKVRPLCGNEDDNDVNGTNEMHKNIITTSCIANRTRRKSLDVNKLNELRNLNDQSIYATPASPPQVVPTSLITISILDSSLDETAINDVIEIDDSICSYKSPSAVCDAPVTLYNTPNSIATTHLTPNTPATSTAQSHTTLASHIRRGQRLRRRPRRFLDKNDESVDVKNNLGNSPAPRLRNWSNLKAQEDAYRMPNYVRINGMLLRVLNKNVEQQQQHTHHNTFGAQTHFAKSYNLLLN